VSVGDALDALVLTLDNPTAEVELLVQLGDALALEIDTAQLADDQNKTKSASAAVKALSALAGEMIAKGRAVVADPDEAEDWAATTIVDLAPVRNAKESGAGDARARSRRGGAAAS